MKKINSYLKSYVKNINGNLLGIGIKDDKILELIEKNDNIKICDLLNSNNIHNEDGKGKKMKTISIKKIRKIFKKKRFHYIIANAEELKPYFKTFVRDSIYINKDIIYIYTSKEYDYSRLKIMYERYNAKIAVEKCRDGNILIIDTSNTKDHRVKNKIYYIYDIGYELIDSIGEFLVK